MEVTPEHTIPGATEGPSWLFLCHPSPLCCIVSSGSLRGCPEPRAFEREAGEPDLTCPLLNEKPAELAWATTQRGWAHCGPAWKTRRPRFWTSCPLPSYRLMLCYCPIPGCHLHTGGPSNTFCSPGLARTDTSLFQVNKTGNGPWEDEEMEPLFT